MTAYYFFEERHREYATVHDARCGHCRLGLERRARALTPSRFTYWHGPLRDTRAGDGPPGDSYDSYDLRLLRSRAVADVVVLPLALTANATGGPMSATRPSAVSWVLADAMTGKLDVRDVVARLPDEEDDDVRLEDTPCRRTPLIVAATLPRSLRRTP